VPARLQFRAAALLAAKTERERRDRRDCDRAEDPAPRPWRARRLAARGLCIARVRARRKRGCGRIVDEARRRDEAVAEPRQRLDETRRMQIVAEQATQVLDGLRQHVRRRTRAFPDFVEELVAAQRAAGRAHELQQHRGSLRRQPRRTGARHQTQRIDVDDVLADGQKARLFRPDAKGCVHARGLAADQHTKSIVINVAEASKFGKPKRCNPAKRTLRPCTPFLYCNPTGQRCVRT